MVIVGSYFYVTNADNNTISRHPLAHPDRGKIWVYLPYSPFAILYHEGYMYVSLGDLFSTQIQKIPLNTSLGTQFFGTPWVSNTGPYAGGYLGMVAFRDTLYVVSYNGNYLFAISWETGVPQRIYTFPSRYSLTYPVNMTNQGKELYLCVLDTVTQQSGLFSYSIDTGSTSFFPLVSTLPTGLANRSDSLYVADASNNVVLQYNTKREETDIIFFGVVPQGLYIYGTNLYVLSTNTNSIVQMKLLPPL
jgi:hypothetical protein